MNRKKSFKVSFFLLVFLLFLSSVYAQQRNTKQFPIYFQFRWNANRMEDEEMFKENVKNILRHIKMMQKYNIKADYYFTGSAAVQFSSEAPEVIEALNRADMSINHHGANRPPDPQPWHRNKGENWEEDVEAIMDYEVHRIHPETGILYPNQVGGMKGLRLMFDKPIISTGRFTEAAILYVEKQFGVRMCIGLEENTGAPTDRAWFMGILNIPDGPYIHPNKDLLPWIFEGRGDVIQKIRDIINNMDRTMFNQITNIMHDWDFLRGGAGRNVLRPLNEREKIWEKYEEMVSFLVSYPESKYIVLNDMINLVIDDRKKTVDMKSLRRASDIISSSRNCPPIYIDLGNDYLALADVFQALVFALTYFESNNNLPLNVEMRDIIGPTAYSGLINVDMEIEGRNIIKTASFLSDKLAVGIPSEIRIWGNEYRVEKIVNPGQFLYAMAETFQNIASEGVPGKITLKLTLMQYTNLLCGCIVTNTLILPLNDNTKKLP